MTESYDLAGSGRFGEPLSEYLELLSSDPTNFVILRKLSLHLFENCEVDKSINTIEPFLRSEPIILNFTGASLIGLAEFLVRKATFSMPVIARKSEEEDPIIKELLYLNLAAVGFAPLALTPNDYRKKTIELAMANTLQVLQEEKSIPSDVLKKRFDAYHAGYKLWAQCSPRPEWAPGGEEFCTFCALADPTLYVFASVTFMSTVSAASQFVRSCLSLPRGGQ